MTSRDEPQVDPAVRAVVRQLIALLATEREPGEHLLDVEVDGVRCRLVRVSAPSHAGPSSTLSPREKEIARMVAMGHKNQSIADVLGISAWTVSTHLRRIFAKLDVNSRAAMVAAVLREPRPPSHVPATHVRASREDATTASVSGGVPYR
jgi:DNA-binding CsgD family transcriptional regulator